MSSPPPPPNWRLCPSRGEIISELFVPFKVPLDSRYDDQLLPMYRFSPTDLFKSLDGKGRLGMVIDLTKTSRYYDKTEFERLGVKHVKIECAGRGEVPEPQFPEFLKEVTEFQDKNPEKLIGVHCTHGFNRTGYMICSYLAENGSQIETAIQLFLEARPPGIYKHDYLRALLKKYVGSEEEIMFPEYPSWDVDDEEPSDGKRKREDELEDGQKRLHSEVEEAPKPSGIQDLGNVAPGQLISITGIEGKIAEAIQPSKADYLRKFCQDMCNWGQRRIDEFPGSQPVSLLWANIEFLRHEPYLVSWKADGTRYMSVVMLDGCYFVDRDFRIAKIPNLIFPKREALDQKLDKTLIEGELVVDIIEGKKRPRYLMYDLISLNGTKLAERPYHERLKLLEEQVYQPRELAKPSRPEFQKEPFGIRPKPFYPLHEFEKVQNMRKTLPHPSDGLILAPANSPYVPGRDQKLLKWKPANENTVDFLAKVETVRKEGCPSETITTLYVSDKGNLEKFGRLVPQSNPWPLNGKILECALAQPPMWKFHRIREDKSFPNALQTASNVLQSIKDGISDIELLNFIKALFKKP